MYKSEALPPSKINALEHALLTMKYRCRVCGYIYDEEKEGVPFSELPDDWVCPVCGEGKEGFELMDEGDSPASVSAPTVASWEEDGLRELSAGELSALCSNLARGCEKQQLAEEQALFRQISDWFKASAVKEEHDGVRTLIDMVNADLDAYEAAKSLSAELSDRGALRVLTWSEKATMIMRSVLDRYMDDPHFLEHTNVYVCDICGFIYIGDDPPEVCPVCKVPGFMILKVKRRD